VNLYDVQPAELKTMEKGNEITFGSDEIQIYKPTAVVSLKFIQVHNFVCIIIVNNSKTVFVNVKSQYFYYR